MPGRGRKRTERISDPGKEIAISKNNKRTRSRFEGRFEAMATVANVNKSSKSDKQVVKQVLQTPKLRKLMGNKAKVVKHIQFNRQGSNDVNNNATLALSKQNNKDRKAKSNPKVIDTNVSNVSDRVHLDIDAVDSEYGTESDESDREIEPMEQTDRVVVPTNNDDNLQGRVDGTTNAARQDADQAGYQRLLGDPNLKKVFEAMMNEKLAVAKQEWLHESKGKNSVEVVNNNSPARDSVKSPSDTTLYTPALKRAAVENVGRPLDKDKDIMDKISNFVESIRMEAKQDNVDHRDPEPSTSKSGTSKPPGFEEAKRMSERAIIEAKNTRQLLLSHQVRYVKRTRF